MIRLLLFFKKIYVGLLFVALELVCLSIFFSNSAYQRAQGLSASNYVVGKAHEKISGVSNYFSLSSDNERLMAENAALRSQLFAHQSRDTISGVSDSLLFDSIPVHVVKVVRETTNLRDNFITISSGSKQGIEPDMALFNDQGIVGYVLYCSDNFSIAISILNHAYFKSNGKIKGTDFTGSITWDGLNPRIVDMTETPTHSQIEVGDTIMTTSYSNIFPEDLPIGIVVSAEIINGTYFNSRVRIFADMDRLSWLYAVKLTNQSERKILEEKIITQQ